MSLSRNRNLSPDGLEMTDLAYITIPKAQVAIAFACR